MADAPLSDLFDILDEEVRRLQIEGISDNITQDARDLLITSYTHIMAAICTTIEDDDE